MDFLSARTKKNWPLQRDGCCGEVAVSGGSAEIYHDV